MPSEEEDSKKNEATSKRRNPKDALPARGISAQAREEIQRMPCLPGGFQLVQHHREADGDVEIIRR